MPRPKKIKEIPSCSIEDSSLLTTRQVAEKIGFSVGHIKRLRVSGKGPQYIIVGEKSVRYKPESVNLYIEKRNHQSTSEYGRC
jgi:predicted DNA-binding transcriptional regulator AlpA